MKFISYLLVIVQFSLLAYFVLLNKVIPEVWYLKLSETLGVFIGVWAMVVMNRETFSIFPTPKKTGLLIIAGPYQYIRHPMYTAILLVCFSLTLNNPTVTNAIAFFALAMNQLVKLHFEEKLLVHKYAEYSNYQKRSKKLVPFVY